MAVAHYDGRACQRTRPVDLPISIVYSDDELLVIDKPAGVSVLADRSGAPELWAWLGEQRATRLVHRIDKGTSGLLAVARTRSCQRHLARAFAEHRVIKLYLAGCVGDPGSQGTARIDLPLRPGRKSRYRVAGARGDIRATPGGWHLAREEPTGKPSQTLIRAIRSGAARSWYAVRPVTGRRHQIRVHFAWIGHPLLGDHLYGRPGSASQAWPRLALHAHRLALPARDGGWRWFRATPGADLIGGAVGDAAPASR